MDMRADPTDGYQGLHQSLMGKGIMAVDCLVRWLPGKRLSSFFHCASVSTTPLWLPSPAAFQLDGVESMHMGRPVAGRSMRTKACMDLGCSSRGNRTAQGTQGDAIMQQLLLKQIMMHQHARRQSSLTLLVCSWSMLLKLRVGWRKGRGNCGWAGWAWQTLR